MPGYALNVAASVQCIHGGTATPTMPSPRVTASGSPVTTEPPPYAVVGCQLKPNAGGPCVTGAWMTAARRVTVGGQPLLLQDSQATCVPTGTPLMVISTQTRVKAL